jgi:hypothetical protein
MRIGELISKGCGYLHSAADSFGGGGQPAAALPALGYQKYATYCLWLDKMLVMKTSVGSYISLGPSTLDWSELVARPSDEAGHQICTVDLRFQMTRLDYIYPRWYFLEPLGLNLLAGLFIIKGGAESSPWLD